MIKGMSHVRSVLPNEIKLAASQSTCELTRRAKYDH